MEQRDFAEIWNHWYPRLRVHAAQFRGLDQQDREDAVQEILWQVDREWGRYNSRFALSTWIYRIAHSRLVDAQRRKGRQSLREVELAEPDTGATSILRGPEEQVLRSEAEEEVHRALGQLDQTVREIFHLHYSEGLPLAEIGRILGLPEGTVKSHLHRGRERLRQLLEGVLPKGGRHD